MTYENAVDIINSLLVFGSKPGLERVGELVERIGSPDKGLKFVHIAGTNGKGSVCALLSSVLRKAGFRTGLFISPFVLEFRERFQINGEMIPREELASIVDEIYPVVLQMKEEGKIITEFEFVFAIALKWYAKEKCDIVVLETGLGGRFDATNIISAPLASVITSISLDHTAILGDTCEKIAFEKCGIIKPDGITVVYGDQPAGVLDVVRNTCTERRNRLIIADPEYFEKKSGGLDGMDFTFCDPYGKKTDYHIPFIGEHQIKNAAAALFTLSALRDRGLEISDAAIKDGLSEAFFPARAEVLCKDPAVILDGAHNPGGTAAFSSVVREYLSDRKRIAVCGMLADKDVKHALANIVPLFDRVITVTPPNPRAMSCEDLAVLINSEFGIPAEAIDDYTEAFRRAMYYARDISSQEGAETAVVIFGSLYLASDMRRVIISEVSACS